MSAAAWAAAVLLAAPSQAARAPSPKAQRAYAAAVGFCERADFERAMGAFDLALRAQPGWKTATAYRGLCRWAMGDPAGAAEDARAGLQLRPNNAESFAARGHSRMILKDNAGAEADYARALSLAEGGRDAAQANYGLAQVALAAGDNPGARARLDAALKDAPGFALACLTRGAAGERLKDQAGAAADYGRALEINPRFLLARYYRARVYRDQNEPRRALSDIDAFLEQRPDFTDGLYLRSNVRFMLEDFQGVVADLNKVITLDPKRGLAYSNRGMARARLGDRSGALADLRRALQLEPGRREKIQAAIDSLAERPEEPVETPAARAPEPDRPEPRAAASEDASMFFIQ